MTYNVRIWYRLNDEKDFEVYEVQAENERESRIVASNKHKIGISFKAEIL